MSKSLIISYFFFSSFCANWETTQTHASECVCVLSEDERPEHLFFRLWRGQVKGCTCFNLDVILEEESSVTSLIKASTTYSTEMWLKMVTCVNSNVFGAFYNCFIT